MKSKGALILLEMGPENRISTQVLKIGSLPGAFANWVLVKLIVLNLVKLLFW